MNRKSDWSEKFLTGFKRKVKYELPKFHKAYPYAMTLIVVLLQILVFKAAFNMNFYSRLLFAVTTESATACSWAWDWLQDSGQQGQKLPLLMATELRPEGQRRQEGLGEKKMS